MELFISADFNWETKIDKVLNRLSDTGYRQYFDKQIYGGALDGVAIILMCRDPSLHFKQRVRFLRKEKTIYMDIMLDMNQFMNIEQNERDKIVAHKLISEVPTIIAKYKLKDFDIAKFQKDLKKYVSKILA